MDATRLIANILRHDSRTASYKLALIRSLGDVALGFPHLGGSNARIAIPLRVLAEFWVGYYWPFMDPSYPILQAHHAANKQDVSFRLALTELRRQWAELVLNVRPADGFFLSAELRTPHRRRTYPQELVAAYDRAVAAIVHALRQPIRYAGPVGEYTVFTPPQRWNDLHEQEMDVMSLPSTHLNEKCVLIEPEFWRSLCDLSLWIEALCIHEWSLFTEAIANIDRGVIYSLLTDRPDNRRPLTWERNQIEILMLEGTSFTCPWTGRNLSHTDYDLDHLLPISVYPINELWNLVPADRSFNQHVKRGRLPSPSRLAAAEAHIAKTYQAYTSSPQLAPILLNGARTRFSSPFQHATAVTDLAKHTVIFLNTVADARNLPVF